MLRQRLHLFPAEILNDALHHLIGAPAGFIVLQLNVEIVKMLPPDDWHFWLLRQPRLAVARSAQFDLFLQRLIGMGD